jgi:hypothetical protein
VLPRGLRAPVRGSEVAAVVTTLKELSESLRFLGAESDDRSWLAPWFLKCVTHISDDRLGRCLL